MKKVLLSLIVIVFVLFQSCSKNKVYEKYIKIENHKWKRDNIITFDVEIKDTFSKYDIVLAIRHTTYYAFANIKVNVTMISPDKNLRTKDFNIFLRNNDGSFKGDGAGDLWDITYPVFTDISIEKPGTYVFEVQNIMPLFELPDIMDVGLVVRKVKNN